MGRLGAILGSNATGPGGAAIVAAAEGAGAVVLPRHGSGGEYLLPHRIDHAANLRALAERGCDRVLAVCSVGSLDPAVPVGAIVCPDDFIALGTTVTALDDATAHATPGIEAGWRRRVLAAWEASGAGELHDGGVYWQTNGPRFETPAEVRLISAHADLVGMTMASECVVAGELGLSYACVCVVDNLANGVEAEPLSPEELLRHRERNAERLRADLAAALPGLT